MRELDQIEIGFVSGGIVPPIVVTGPKSSSISSLSSFGVYDTYTPVVNFSMLEASLSQFFAELDQFLKSFRLEDLPKSEGDQTGSIVVTGLKVSPPPEAPPIQIDVIALRDYIRDSVFNTPVPALVGGTPVTGPSSPPSPPVPSTSFTSLPGVNVGPNARVDSAISRDGTSVNGFQAGITFQF